MNIKDVLNIQEKIRKGAKPTEKEDNYYRERMSLIKKKARWSGRLTKEEETALEEYENTHTSYDFNVIIEADRANQEISDEEEKVIRDAVEKALVALGYPKEDLDIG